MDSGLSYSKGDFPLHFNLKDNALKIVTCMPKKATYMHGVCAHLSEIGYAFDQWTYSDPSGTRLHNCLFANVHPHRWSITQSHCGLITKLYHDHFEHVISACSQLTNMHGCSVMSCNGWSTTDGP